MIKKLYSNEWLFFKNTILPIFLTLLFISTSLVILSYSYSTHHPDKTKNRIYNLKKNPEKSGFLDSNKFKTFRKIFLDNLIVSFETILIGFIPFLFLSVLSVLFLSLQIGLVLAGNNLFAKIDQFSFLVSIFLHGIFEVPAIIYASSIGIYLTLQTSKMVLPSYRSKAVQFKILFKNVCWSFALVIFPLLTIAAFIEVFITPLLQVTP